MIQSIDIHQFIKANFLFSPLVSKMVNLIGAGLIFKQSEMKIFESHPIILLVSQN